jgi:sugar lactone lactonase YvrE
VDWEVFRNGPAAANVNANIVSAPVQPTLLLDLHSELGEGGIVYDDVRNEIVWTDILGPQFQCLSIRTGQLTSTPLDKWCVRLGC